MKIKNLCRVLFLFLSILLLTSCFDKESELIKQQKEIYQIAVEVGYDGTFDEWLESIQGEQTVPEKDGKDVELNVKDGFIKWRKKGDTDWYNLVSLESLLGSKGLNGKKIELNVSKTHIQWRYLGEESYKDLIELSIINIDSGKVIKGVEINNLGELIVIYTDDVTQNLGKILKSFQVQFVDYNGTLINTQQVIYSMDAILPKSPIRLGYKCVGWDKEFINVKSDLIVTAIYTTTSNALGISFVENGGSDVDDMSIENGKLLSYLPKTSLTGHLFIGWYTDVKLINKFKEDTVLSNNLVLYAKWEPIEYRVDFDTNGGAYIDSIFIPYGEALIEFPTPIKTDYKFLGWEYNGTKLSDTFTYNYDKNITLKAIWHNARDLYGYTIRIASGSNVFDTINPFDTNYTAPDKLAKQQAWNWVKETYNCNIEVVAYPDDAEWGEPRWHYIEEQAASNTADYDFYTVPDSQISRLVEAKALIDVTSWYAAYGKGFMDAIHQSSGTYKNSIYSITDSKPGIYNAMFYNIDLLEKLGLDKTPAQIFNEGDWTYSKFRDYAIEAQTKLNVLSTTENPYYAVAGWPTYYWVGMSNAGGVKLFDVNTMQMNIKNEVSIEAADTLRTIKKANAMDPNSQIDEKVISWNSGRALFNTGDLWFVNTDGRWPENLWGEGDLTRYGYVPFPRRDGTAKENQSIGLNGTDTWVMPVGRDYDGYGPVCNTETIYRAIVDTFLKTEEFLKSNPDYDENKILKATAQRYTESNDSVEALIYMSKKIKTNGFFDPLSTPYNQILDTGYGIYSSAINAYIMGNRETFPDVIENEEIPICIASGEKPCIG
jgi:uncharacterized repeat protein (TIGR02543 family)